MRKIVIILISAMVLLSGLTFIAAGSDIAMQSGDPYDEEQDEETGYYTCCCGWGAIILVLIGISLAVMAVARNRYARRMK